MAIKLLIRQPNTMNIKSFYDYFLKNKIFSKQTAISLESRMKFIGWYRELVQYL